MRIVDLLTVGLMDEDWDCALEQTSGWVGILTARVYKGL